MDMDSTGSHVITVAHSVKAYDYINGRVYGSEYPPKDAQESGYSGAVVFILT